MDYNGKRLLLGLSGGINSAAVLCWLKESGVQPGELHLFYAHFKEHSPDTARFVIDGIRYARKHFNNVHARIARNSVIDFFEASHMIPHPTNGACSKYLKIVPMLNYAAEHGLKIDLVGYVKHELKRRTERQKTAIVPDLFSVSKLYPIGSFTDDWCFEIVDRNIGWHPAIYDIRNAKGKRIFKHNNCLPCKNMDTWEIETVKTYFPQYYTNAMALSNRLSLYWGRDKDDFYLRFGRDLGQESTCGACVW